MNTRRTRRAPRREIYFSQVVTFACTREMRERLEVLRATMGGSLGELLRHLVKRGLEK